MPHRGELDSRTDERTPNPASGTKPKRTGAPLPVAFIPNRFARRR